MSTSTKELRDRWLSPDGRALAAATWEWLTDPQAGRPDRLGVVDGRADLRGFAVELGAPPARVSGTSWVDLDLSNARLTDLRFDAATWINVRADRAVFNNLWWSGCHIQDVALSGCSLKGARLGTAHTTIEASHFARCDLRSSSLTTGVVDGCRFDDCRWDGSEHWLVTWRNTNFTGDMVRVVFDQQARNALPAPVPLTRVDLSGSTWTDVELLGAVLENVRLPDGVWVIPDAVDTVPELLASLEDMDAPGVGLLRHVLRRSVAGTGGRSVPGAVAVINPDDLTRHEGAALRTMAARVLRQPD